MKRGLAILTRIVAIKTCFSKVRVAIALLLIVTLSFWSIALSLSPSVLAAPEQSSSPDGAQAYIIAPKDGSTVTSPVAVKFGLSGMGIAPAGVDVKNTGHHHLLIDMTELPDVTQPLPATDQLKHFGAGQTETQLDLASGPHTLQLVLGNYSHIPHDPPVTSESITITVE